MSARHFSYLFMFSFGSPSYLRPSSFPSNQMLFHRTSAFCTNFVELVSRDEKSIGLQRMAGCAAMAVADVQIQ